MPLPAASERLRDEGRSLLRVLVRHERLVTAALLGLAVLAGLRALRPAGGPTVGVVAAAHDLVAGSTLGPADLVLLPLPASASPDGALSDPARAVGRVLALPAGRHEVLSENRLLGRPLLDAVLPGSVGVPVRVADAGAAALLRAGDRVDVVLTADAGTRTVAADLPVVAVPAAGDALRPDGALVVLAVPGAGAAELAAASASGRLTLAVHGRR